MTIFYFFLAALALGILVFFHELGHYFAARWMGMKVETFSIGFGKPLVKWKIGQVDWQIGWLPFGGYVKIAGMELSKDERQKYKEPYEVPQGYFSKSPWRRIFVAISGPLANFIIALLLFVAIFSMGGREKPFSEYSQIIGWVDPQSELFAQGVRPGDILTDYNGKPFKGSKDLLYAAMLDGKDVTLGGYHIDTTTQAKTPFSYTIQPYPAPGSLDGIMTTGVAATARYLVYDRYPSGTDNPLPEDSPMQASGIAYGDRILWAQGEWLYSMNQLSYLLNNNETLLTIKRGDTTLLNRQKRVPTSDLLLPPHIKDELSDWQYDAHLTQDWFSLLTLPYIINSDGYVEGPAKFIDRESREEAFPQYPYDAKLQEPLEPGDRIIAIDGIPVTKGHEILTQLQTPHVQLIVEPGASLHAPTTWKDEDQLFEKQFNAQALTLALAGKPSTYRLLKPVTPKSIGQFALSEETRTQLQENVRAQREQIAKLRDASKREAALGYLEQTENKKILGIYLQDESVNYNPGPFTLLGNVFTETYQTLRALIFGHLHPKWISGPVGIVQVIHRGWTLGLSEALFWIAAISVNLGFLNLLPIPVLDGGYILLSLFEWVTRKRIKAKTMERLIIPFVILLIGLIVFLTFQDLTRLF